MGRRHPGVTPPIRLWHLQARPLQVRTCSPDIIQNCLRHTPDTIGFYNIHPFSGLEGDLRWRWKWRISRKCLSPSLQSNCLMNTRMEKSLIKVDTISLIFFLKNLMNRQFICIWFAYIANVCKPNANVHEMYCKREAQKSLTTNFWQESADKTQAALTGNCLQSTK